ncbi:hypothetical protein MGYG_01672 [Nannizzia gypsea CBS 118893]|uniref:Uncharacterized protein n=1 Tax=Arthroderma gypseum (strain ATCC MYA-4604 / CBS 118893) TaxID=535722 RepID=E5R2J2_ARTGP|nr:hypothetical protein MGYG_01672 [Nannizzia gypsea CBS 118893]EFQ98650.1 hypothetical protein MGYG_01672 [Nannizzia gypsea CBS 118893]
MSSPTNLLRKTLLARNALSSSFVSSVPSIAPASRCSIPALSRASHSHSHSHATHRTASKSNTQLDPRWLSSVKRRIGKCIAFGMGQDLVPVAGGVLEEIARDWRELVAGSEGFLTGEKYCGLHKHNVVWGEMVSTATSFLFSLSFYASLLEPVWFCTDLRLPFLGLYGHVNNVMYVRYAETGRVNWSRNIAIHHDPENSKEWSQLVGSTSIGYILKSIKVDYKFPMMFPDQISVYHKLSNEPPAPNDPNPGHFSNLHLDVLIMSEAKQRPAARCEEDVVLYDYRIAKKLNTLPTWMLVQYRKIWEAQEAAKRVNRGKVQDIERRVRQLEVGTWDREGAVESMGSAAR